jgi:hypothetical protein
MARWTLGLLGGSAAARDGSAADFGSRVRGAGAQALDEARAVGAGVGARDAGLGRSTCVALGCAQSGRGLRESARVLAARRGPAPGRAVQRE